MLVFTCPHCGISVGVPEDCAGKVVRCGGCRNTVEAPRPSVARVAADPSSIRTDPPTLPPSPPASPRANGSSPAPAREMSTVEVDFLGAPQGPGELGRLGPYRVLRVLGNGAMGVVFEAEDPQLHRPVALKALVPALAASPAARERFLREGRAAAAVAHDHVVTIYQVGEDRGIPFLAMQLLQGETLAARLHRERRLPVAEVVRVGREVAEGLAAAHARGVVHRDVKPSNVWLEAGTGRVKLLDFGLALAADTDSRLTQSGALIGTPAYIAPEQTRGQADARSDLFSLGCVLYRACTGELPFKGKDTLTTLTALATETPRPVRELNPQVPPPLAALITRLLAKDPADRPASARAVADALLSQWAKSARLAAGAAADPAPPGEDGLGSDTEPGLAPAPRRTVAPAWVLALVGAAAVVVLLLGGTTALVLAWALSRPRAEQPRAEAAKADKPDAGLFTKGPRVYLSELQEFDVNCTGPAPFAKDGTIGDKLIQVNRRPSPHGLAMYPPWAPGFASVRYRLNGQAAVFKATVAINETSNWVWSPATFTVYGDGIKLWESKGLSHTTQRVDECQVKVTGVNILELRVQCVNGSNGAEAVWVEPRLLKKADTPDP